MDDDGLEVIDLTAESEPDPASPHAARRLSRRQVAVLAVGIGVVAVAAAAIAHDRSGKQSTLPDAEAASTSPTFFSPTTTWSPPAGLARLVSGRYVAVIYGTPVLIDESGPVRTLLADIPGNAMVGIAQRGAALLLYQSTTTRVIVGPRFDGVRIALPVGLDLLPDAEGRWSSSRGAVKGSNELHPPRFPAGTTPVARLRDGYLLTSDAPVALLEWQPGSPPERIGAGNARILTIADNLVAWMDDVRAVVHVTNLTTRRTADIPTASETVTARFSPDRSRLAILSGRLSETMTLADPTSGRVIAEVLTASGGNGLPDFDNVPAAFQPVPFSWDGTGNLVVIAQTPVGYFVKTAYPDSGVVFRTVAAPEGLQQLVAVG